MLQGKTILQTLQSLASCSTGRNLVKRAAESTELDDTSITSKENVPTPRRKSVNGKRSIGKKNEESVDESQSRKSTRREMNKRKSKLEEENKVAETSPLVENAQTPNRTLSQMKKRRKSMQILHDHPGTSTTSTENEQTPTRKSINIKRSIGKEKKNEPAATCVSVDESQSRKSSQRKINKRKSKLEEGNEVDTSTTTKENIQTPTRKSVNIKRSTGMEKENEEPALTCISVEESPGTKSSQRKMNKRKRKLEEETEVAKTSPLVENAQSPNTKSSQMKKRRRSMQILQEQPTVTYISVEESPRRKSSQAKMNRRKSMWGKENEVVATCISVEDSSGRKSTDIKMNKRKSKGEEENKESELNDIVRLSQECEISSSLVIANVERNDEIPVPTSDQNEEDVAEILNSTFEVVEEDPIPQTPTRKRSVRFAEAVETKRQTASMDNSPKFSTPVLVNSKQRSSQHKGTPHPSAKKRPASILKISSSKKFPSSSKDKSLRGTGSVRKMPDFSSIHKAQFEKMESIVDFSHRRLKCVRKLETQAADDSNKQVQPKPSAVVKPMEQTKGNTRSRIPVAPQNTSRSGTPRTLSSGHIPLASFRVLTEKNFDARRSTPHTINSRPSLKKFDARRSTPQAINSRPSFTKMENNYRQKPVNNPKPQRITYEQAKATIQNKKPLAVVKREADRQENRNILKGVRLNRRFELQMQHRKINV